MLRRLLIGARTAFLATTPVLAWNPAGHMVTGSVAYDELQRNAPATVARVVAILRQHPQYESLWKPQLAGMSEPDQERYLFMLAARWPDDIRRNRAFDRPEWHYIDYPYKPPGQPASVRAPAPPADNLVTAFQRNVAAIQSAAPESQKAIALCWIFHLIGDAHQPLHTVSLFTTQFPKGDRGGNLFYISLYKPANPASSRTENLHAYWDSILLTNDHYGAARQRAMALENAHPRRSLDELAKSQFETWVKTESFGLAVSTVYRRGSLKSGADRNRGAPLPRDYPAAAERVAERRVTLAGYRLADFLRTNFP
jgi:S1/P1 Nuclease